MVTAVRITALPDLLLDPDSDRWSSAPQEALKLDPTPLAVQPSAYVQAAWPDRPYGVVEELRVRAAHNGDSIFFRLAWADRSKDDRVADTDRFPDAAAVLLPFVKDAPLANMGIDSMPVNAWYWRADQEGATNVTARGLGTTVRHPDGFLRAQARHENREWSVVISRAFSRPFSVKSDLTVLLAPGHQGQVGFAVWQGSNQERGGLKAVTLAWQPLEIEE